MLHKVLNLARQARVYYKLPKNAKAETIRDRSGLTGQDIEIDQAVEASIAWLGVAQDNSTSRDGGVARDFSLIEGWNASYPETTGYIVPTILTYAKLHQDDSLRLRAERMLDWLLSIQFPEGGFQGSVIGAVPRVPVTFNTGQILLGLVSGTEELGDKYRDSMLRAADWLVQTQDSDGCWRRHPSPFAEQGEKTYDTHVAWGLFEAARLEHVSRYSDAALANVKWALSFQRSNGWLENCCLEDPGQPLTHTLGYALRGIIEAYQFTKIPMLLEASCKTADGLLTAIQKDGFLPGRLDANWSSTVDWSCLTGTVQIAACWLLLYKHTNDEKYWNAGCLANQYVRRTLKFDAPPETHGAVKGSFPISGGYCTFMFPNWACKFFIDSNILEKTIREGR